jgi:hypothetical protein
MSLFVNNPSDDGDRPARGETPRTDDAPAVVPLRRLFPSAWVSLLFSLSMSPSVPKRRDLSHRRRYARRCLLLAARFRSTVRRL